MVCGYQSDGVCCENRANLELADVARQGLRTARDEMKAKADDELKEEEEYGVCR